MLHVNNYIAVADGSVSHVQDNVVIRELKEEDTVEGASGNDERVAAVEETIDWMDKEVADR